MKCWKIVYAALVCIVLAAPILLMPFAQTDSAEKRKLSEFPDHVTENGVNLEFTSEVDTWLSEHFPFRSQLISLNNYWKAAVFQTSDEDQVVVGKDGWLFFAETLPDYLGNNRFSDVTLKRILTTVSLMEEYVRENDADFVFTVAPNKNTVYPQYMPDRYKKIQEKTNLQRLTDALQDTAYYTNLSAAFDMSQQVYQKRDSHWNAFGALCGYRALMRTANRDASLFDNVSHHIENTWRGDLDDMIFPALNILDEQVVYDLDWSYTFTSNYHTEEDIRISTENPRGDGSLFMFRDSFANALLPFMAQTFETAVFSRETPYNLCEAVQYDTVVLEIVERNLQNLLKTAPVMPAPERTAQDVKTAADVSVMTRKTADFLQVYGTIKDETDTVYLRLENGEDIVTVQAFPIYEQQLLGDTAKNGFSAYVPLQYEGYTVSVLVK